MKKIRDLSLLLAATTFLLSSFARGDWPHFGGPDWNNVSRETGLADQWPADGPTVLWEIEVHEGYSSPAVRGGKVYLIDREDEDSLLLCLDLATGEELWRVAFHDPGEMRGARFAGTRGTPTLGEDAAYLITGYGTFVCIDLNTREIRWRHNLTSDYDKPLHQFGIAHAPVIHGNLALVAPYASDAGVAAYDRKSGRRRWVSPELGGHAYVSPRVIQLGGDEMVVAAGSLRRAPRARRGRDQEEDSETPPREDIPGMVAGLSLRDGSILWKYQGWQCQIAIPHPVELPGDRLFLTGGYNAGSAMIRIVRRGTRFSVEELYKTDDVGAQIHQPIQVDDYLLIASNSNNRNDGLSCMSLDGDVLWRTRDMDDAPLFERGPFLLADGKLILLDGKTGILHLARADASGYQELASAQMAKENDMAWAPLALSNGKLLLRDWTTLKCIDLR